MKSQGLGDTIAKFTHLTKLDKVADYVAKLAGVEGCGCEERKKYLNEIFPYKTTYREFKILRDFSIENLPFKTNEVYRINNEHPLHKHVISLVEQKLIEEL